LTLAVGKRFYSHRLDHDHRPIAAYNREKLILNGTLKGHLKGEHIAMERECGRNVGNDEEQ
jgi:hypothetical protein